MRLKITSLALAMAALGLAGVPALAQHEEHGRTEGGHFAPTPRGEFHGEIGRFHEHDWMVWHNGRWYHGDHGGRLGWWWIAGGIWYFYPYPIYPYPDPYLPPDLPVPAVPVPPVPNVWYYCGSAKAFYPYVATCPEGWKAETPNPSMTAPPPPK